MGKRNQEKRRAKKNKKKERDARQQTREAAGARSHPAGEGRPPSPGEAVEAVCLQLAHASVEGVESVIRSAAAELARRFGEPAHWAGVSRALHGVAERAVRSCWEAGWQPADLVRLAGRELTGSHVRLAVDVVAAEARAYAAATLDPRWSAQLRELPATVWWDDDGSYLDALGEREDLDRVDTVRCLLELLRLFHTMPRLAPIAPPPGSSRNGAARRPATNSGSESHLLNRIRALLAKAESTEFPEEAEALTAKAQQLMAHHSISAALLAADVPGRDEPAARRIGIDNPYEAPKALLLDVVAAANRCRTVWSRSLGFSTTVGYEPDLDAVELLYTSLLVQATTAMNQAGSRRDRYGRSRTRSFRQSFLVAYGNRIGERLNAATEQATSDAAAGVFPDGLDGFDGDGAAGGASGLGESNQRLLPVLASRAEAVDDAMERMFPELTTRTLRSNDREGWAHGRAAADRAVLHGRGEVDSSG